MPVSVGPTQRFFSTVLSLPDVVAARALATPRPSWRAVFLKAFAHVAAANPLLRRCLVPWPISRVYQHPETIAIASVERSDGIGFVRVTRPEKLRLSEIDALLEGEGSPPPRHSRLLRLGVAWSGSFRAQRFGTMSIGPHPLPILMPALHHGLIDKDEVDVRLTYDRRILDDEDAIRVLAALEDVLHERILTELRYLESVEAA